MKTCYFWCAVYSSLVFFGSYKWLIGIACVQILNYSLFVYVKKAPANDFKVAIIGAGFSGLATAIKLDELGIKYDIYEAEPELAGTWRSSVYPGCACDIASHLYCYSFEPNAHWSRHHSEQREIHAYLKGVQRKYNIRINYNKRVDSVVWDEAEKKYWIRINGGETTTANFIVHASGALREPFTPDFPGLADFHAKMMHSAHWDTSYDVTGKRVAVVGTGASAVQIVPAIKSKVKDLFVYQRTATWTMPRFFERSHSNWTQAVFEYIPGTMYVNRMLIWMYQETYYFVSLRTNAITYGIQSAIMKWYVKYVVKDPEVAKKLTPDYIMGCKRVTPSDTYLQSFNSPNVHLITDKVTRITKEGIQVADGSVEPVDVIVFATGYSVVDSFVGAFEVVNGSKNLKQISRDCPTSYKGMTYPDFPNYFSLLGPHSLLTHTSKVWMIECQLNYITDCLRKMIEQQLSAVVPKRSALKDFEELVNSYMRNKTFYRGCLSWYRSDGGEGVNFALWPSSLLHYWWITRTWDQEHYHCS